MTSECKCEPANAILNEFFWHCVFLLCVFDVHCPHWVIVQAIVLLPTGLSCAQLGHLLIPKQAGDLKMLYLKVFLHRHFREGTGWAEWGCDCVCLLGLRLCCLLQACASGWKENHEVGSGPSDLYELRGTEYKTCDHFLKQLIAAPLSFQIVFSLGSKNKEMF